MMENLLSLKVLLCMVAVPLMLLAAVISDRQRAEEMLRGVSGRLIDAQEQERQRISRDLHDDIGQRLSLVAIKLQQIEEYPPDSAVEVSRRMGELWKQTFEISNDVQALSHELHSAKLEYLGIVGAMRGFCIEFGQQQRLEIDFSSHDLPNPLPSPEVSLALFRVLQEALHNASKHSGVSRFQVELWGRPGEINLTVSDSGAGFDVQAAREGRGLGLTSMQERVKVVNGKLSIESQPNRGTVVRARVRLDSPSDSIRAAG
jgi:signal transduction histidine kinase